MNKYHLLLFSFFCNTLCFSQQKEYDLQPGIYVGIRWNSLLGIHNFKVQGEGDFAKNRQNWYKRFCEKMVTELCTRYGDLFMIWFDGDTDDPKGLIPVGDVQSLKEWGEEIDRRFASPLAQTSGKKGERIRTYRIETKVNGKWKMLCSGESVDHKRIERFAPAEVTSVRLTVPESIAMPDIINFSIYNTINH